MFITRLWCAANTREQEVPEALVLVAPGSDMPAKATVNKGVGRDDSLMRFGIAHRAVGDFQTGSVATGLYQFTYNIGSNGSLRQLGCHYPWLGFQHQIHWLRTVAGQQLEVLVDVSRTYYWLESVGRDVTLDGGAMQQGLGVEFVVVAVDVGRGLLPSDAEPFHKLCRDKAAFPKGNQLNSTITSKGLLFERGHGSGQVFA